MFQTQMSVSPGRKREIFFSWILGVQIQRYQEIINLVLFLCKFQQVQSKYMVVLQKVCGTQVLLLYCQVSSILRTKTTKNSSSQYVAGNGIGPALLILTQFNFIIVFLQLDWRGFSLLDNPLQKLTKHWIQTKHSFQLKFKQGDVHIMAFIYMVMFVGLCRQYYSKRISIKYPCWYSCVYLYNSCSIYMFFAKLS
eukprot:TRINITY_DN12069_c1_g1_i6.p2 TRINITY_DN12069_c1_g1~~TRINITY_DN12069_c1_g1_i6.p2  ORF type:complete len:195 (+),score=-19.74 TRINITY_DN12069_c1_g1_i6:154-738(+)